MAIRQWNYRYGDQPAILVLLTDEQALMRLEYRDPRLCLEPMFDLSELEVPDDQD